MICGAGFLACPSGRLESLPHNIEKIQSNYAAANAGIIGFTKAVALEGARFGVTVNAICPEFVETEMLLEVPEKLKEQIISRIPLGRFARTDEIAKAVVYLISENGAYITGQSLNINGGLYM